MPWKLQEEFKLRNNWIHPLADSVDVIRGSVSLVSNTVFHHNLIKRTDQRGETRGSEDWLSPTSADGSLFSVK